MISASLVSVFIQLYFMSSFSFSAFKLITLFFVVKILHLKRTSRFWKIDIFGDYQQKKKKQTSKNKSITKGFFSFS